MKFIIISSFLLLLQFTVFGTSTNLPASNELKLTLIDSLPVQLELEQLLLQKEQLSDDLETAQIRVKSYDAQLDIINQNRVNYTIEYIQKIKKEIDTNNTLVKSLEVKLKNLDAEIKNKSKNKSTSTPLTQPVEILTPTRNNKKLVADKALNVPPFRCEVNHLEEGDETSFDEFFFHTPPQLKSFFKDTPYFRGKSKMSKHKSGAVYLTFSFVISTTTAKRDFGSLDKNAFCFVTLFSGETIRLSNLTLDQGRINSNSKETTYEGVYLLNNSDIRSLKKSPVASIRVVWSTGFEEYEVHNINLLKNQLNCL